MAETSLRWYYPDQVQRVRSQFFVRTKNTPSQNLLVIMN